MAYDIVVGRDAADKKAFGERGLVYIGKGYVKMGQYTSLSNRILMDISRSHVILVAGKRGSGKAYTLGVITEGLSNLPKEAGKKRGSLIFDTMGIYWTMKLKNEKDKELLEEWGLKPKNLPVRVFVPFGHYDFYVEKGIPADDVFALDVNEMQAEDWVLTFGLDLINPIAVLIQRTIAKLRDLGSYDLDDILAALEKDEQTPKEI